MKGSTLVLNADGLPVSVVPLSTIDWQEAVRILVCDRAVAVENYDQWVVRSPSLQLRMPSVIRLNNYRVHNGKVEFSRHNVILRDMYTCQYCDKRFEFHDLTFDHVTPRRHGGKTNWENITSACYACNQEKAHYTSMKPKTKPFRPTYWQLASNRKKIPITVPNKEWVEHLYWEGEVSINQKETFTNIDIVDETIPMLDAGSC